uniref:Ras association domain-containing protein 9 n=1 Tax=Ceratitis capitata TaxID=7213 RepID=W8BNA5_CERCA
MPRKIYKFYICLFKTLSNFCVKIIFWILQAQIDNTHFSYTQRSLFPMAVQQNSTLIYDNLDDCPSLLKETEELSRYSPILPLKRENNIMKYQEKQLDNNNNNDNKNSRIKDLQKCSKYAKSSHNRNYAASSCSTKSGRSRTISLSGVNSTEAQGHKEIPIWLGEEPRYVSGVNSRTTCTDIIKALIDDEIRNGGNHDYCANRNKFDAASRDYTDYVITECWRGIERSYDGNMAILPVWKAWSRVHNEIRLSLKHKQDVAEPAPPKQCKNWLQSLRKYFAKLWKFTKRNNKTLPPPAANKQLSRLLPIEEEADCPDEIVFILLPDKKYDNLTEPQPENSKHLRATANNVNDPSTKAEMLKKKLYSLSETRVSMCRKKRFVGCKTPKKRKACTKQSENVANVPQIAANNCIRRRKDAPLRNSLRHKLAQKTNEIDTLYKREYELTKRLTHKCQLYKQHNELYTKADQQMEISIGEIQRSVEQYAEQIIQTENELRELKNEIKHDISIVNNLKRMTLNAIETAVDCGVPITVDLNDDNDESNRARERRRDANAEMQFVDNIYEFCDNNASMLV